MGASILPNPCSPRGTEDPGSFPRPPGAPGRPPDTQEGGSRHMERVLGLYFKDTPPAESAPQSHSLDPNLP